MTLAGARDSYGKEVFNVVVVSVDIAAFPIQLYSTSRDGQSRACGGTDSAVSNRVRNVLAGRAILHVRLFDAPRVNRSEVGEIILSLRILE